MTAVAAFEVLTDENPETVKSNLSKLWIWKVVKLVLDTKNKSLVYILEYIFYKPEEEKSIREIVNYLINISTPGYIYYYPSWDAYSADEEDEDLEISVNDIFTEKYEPSLCGWGMKFLIRKP